MMKNKKKSTKKTQKASKKLNPKLSNDIRHLETLIKFSKRNITNQGTAVDEFFENQTKRLESELKRLKS